MVSVSTEKCKCSGGGIKNKVSIFFIKFVCFKIIFSEEYFLEKI